MSVLDPTCPRCLNKARTKLTRFGRRHDCCGLSSWNGAPLETPEVKVARQRARAAFNAIWQRAERAYEIAENPLSENYERAVQRIRRSMRVRARAYVAACTGLHEPECDIDVQRDIRKLDAIGRVSRETTPEIVRDWWKQQQRERAHEQERA